MFKPLTYKTFLLILLFLIIITICIKLYNTQHISPSPSTLYTNTNNTHLHNINSIDNLDNLDNLDNPVNPYNLDNPDNIERFESVLQTLKDNKKSENNTTIFKNSNNKSNFKKKVRFDDIINDAESIDVGKYTIDNNKKSFFTYINSFGKDKFKNVSGTTTESFEKFGYFKDKFFEIFI